LVVDEHDFLVDATSMTFGAKGFHVGVAGTTTLVRRSGRKHARVLFVGDALGAEDAVLLQVPVLVCPDVPAGGDVRRELLVALAQGALAVAVIGALLVHCVGALNVKSSVGLFGDFCSVFSSDWVTVVVL